MKRVINLTAALAMAVAVTACAGDDARDTDKPAATGTGGTVAGTTGTFEADRSFLEEQLAMGTAEIELGRLAQKRAQHADVKEFAAMMVRDHQEASEELKPLAAKATTGQSTAQTATHDDHKDLIDDLSKLSGREFDRKYIDEMIDDHQEGINDLEGKAENASHPDVKQWAAKTLPTMRQHLERAKAIKQTLDRAGNQ